MKQKINLKIVTEKDEEIGRVLEFDCDTFQHAYRCFNALRLRKGERVIEVRMREEWTLV